MTAEASMHTPPAWPSGRVELRCGECGYGAVVAHPPGRCPMCGTDAWHVAVVRRLSNAAGAVAAHARSPVGIPGAQLTQATTGVASRGVDGHTGRAPLER